MSRRSTSDTGVRAVGVIGGLWGVVVLVRARRTADRLGLAGPGVPRLLGARHVVQGLALAAAPRPPVRAACAVDVVHALSMVALTGSPRYRRAALTSGAVAIGLAAATWSAHDDRPTTPQGPPRS